MITISSLASLLLGATSFVLCLRKVIEMLRRAVDDRESRKTLQDMLRQWSEWHGRRYVNVGLS